MMPEMNGIELLGAALKIDPDLVGIIMTSGVEGFLSPPPSKR